MSLKLVTPSAAACTRSLLALGLLLTLAACRESSRKALLGDACAKIVVRFEDEISSSANVCQTELDCACYGSISEEIAPCGAVIASGTASRLQSLATEFEAAGCRRRTQCAPSLCKPRCVRGHCE